MGFVWTRNKTKNFSGESVCFAKQKANKGVQQRDEISESLERID